MMSTPVGLTREAGFEIGVSRTVDAPADRVWHSLTSEDGLATWLGAGVRIPDPDTAKGTPYRTSDGTRGEFRSVHPGGRLRLTWQPAGWDHDSTVQLTVSSRTGRTVIRFHQERLTGPDERERQREHWRSVMDAVVDRLDGGERS